MSAFVIYDAENLEYLLQPLGYVCLAALLLALPYWYRFKRPPVFADEANRLFPLGTVPCGRGGTSFIAPAGARPFLSPKKQRVPGLA